jgi:hypothetical protein
MMYHWNDVSMSKLDGIVYMFPSHLPNETIVNRKSKIVNR